MPTAFVFGQIIKEKRTSQGITQERLCELVDVPLDVKTLSSMENKANKKFRFDRIKAICKVLELNVEEIVKPEIHSFLKIQKPDAIDLRCGRTPDSQVEKWKKSKLFVSVLPIRFMLDSNAPDRVLFESASLQIPLLAEKQEYSLFYEVMLNPAGKGWLGCVNDFRKTYISPGAIFESELMFRPVSDFAPSWEECIDFFKTSSEPLLEVLLHFEFDHDYYDICLDISIDHARSLLLKGFGNEYSFPRFVQPKVLKMNNVL